MPAHENSYVSEPTPEQKLEQLIRELAPVLHARLGDFFKNPDSDEVIQDVWIVIYRRLCKGDHPDTLKALAPTITWRRCKHYFREKNRRGKIGRSGHDLSHVADAAVDTDSRLDAAERAERTLARLDANHRWVAEQVYGYGRSEAEVAVQLGYPRPRVQRMLAKARNRLRG